MRPDRTRARTTIRSRRRICAIPLATAGGCALAGAYFLTFGYLLVTDRLDGRGRGGRQLAVAQI